MDKLSDIFSITDAEIALIQKQSALLLQKRTNGFNGELNTAGALVENYIKGLLQNHLPHGYRICSGYIATTENINSSDNLIQHDIIIVDARIPSLYTFGVSDIEVVAAEAVYGIIEIKRTLTKKTLAAAIEHLRKTKNILDTYDGGIKSKVKSTNSAIGVSLSIATQAPMYAIIGLDAEIEIQDDRFVIDVVGAAVREFVDMVWSPLAPFLAGISLTNRTNGQPCQTLIVSRNQNNYEPRCFYEGKFDTEASGKTYRIAIACFRTWINNSSGAPMTYEKNLQYFGMV